MGQHKLNKNKNFDPNSEQWNLFGDCNICRRNKHCSKPCRACEIRRRSEFAEAVTSVVIDTLINLHKKADNTHD